MYKCFSFLFFFFSVSLQSFSQEGYTIEQVPFTNVKINDVFWSPRLQLHRDNTLPACIGQIRDSTGRIRNFEKAAAFVSGGGAQEKFEGTFFDDSDVYKVMEGMAYSLQHYRDPAIEELLDYWIDLMEKSQQPDGYLNTFFTLKRDPDWWPEFGRWSDIGRHEMYCGGHMIEAAVAYYKATGKRKMLDVAARFADHWIDIFGPGKRNWVEGHQEPELALVKLYHVTGQKKYLDFAHWLLEERGHGHEFGPMWEWNPLANVDILSDIPVKDITDVKGHAVRAMYMYSAMADIVANKKDQTYLPALLRVWDDVVLRNMYISGGIGSSDTNEGFVEDYHLPNKTSYCETCSSIGMVFWNNRMNLLSGDAKYANVMERSMYNAVLAGVSLPGDRFFYTNPHESDGDRKRTRWHGTACCPSNVARFLPSVGNYVYMVKEKELFVNLYIGGEASLKIGATTVRLEQTTNYPWEGNIKIAVNPDTPVQGIIKMRIPDWCKKYSLKVNGKTNTKKVENGYWTIEKQWTKGDVIELVLDMPVELVASDPRVKDNIGRRAVQRGPIVYCLEQVDNPGYDLDNLRFTSKNRFSVKDGDGILKGIKNLETSVGGEKLTLIPYYAWENRDAGKMLMWVQYTK